MTFQKFALFVCVAGLCAIGGTLILDPITWAEGDHLNYLLGFLKEKFLP